MLKVFQSVPIAPLVFLTCIKNCCLDHVEETSNQYTPEKTLKLKGSRIYFLWCSKATPSSPPPLHPSLYRSLARSLALSMCVFLSLRVTARRHQQPSTATIVLFALCTISAIQNVLITVPTAVAGLGLATPATPSPDQP